MRHAIAELEGQLEGLLDEFCYSTENGNTERAAEASALADDFARALSVLKQATYPASEMLDPVRSLA